MITNKTTPTQHYSPRATPAAFGTKIRSLKFFETIAEPIRVKQKPVRHTPREKLTDAFIAILFGAHGLSQINTRVPPDRTVQRAFGRPSCAEQSVVQETLDACTEQNVRQLQHAVAVLFRRHSHTYRHDYEAGLPRLRSTL